MKHIYELFLVEIMFCFLGTPIGILIFWVGMGVITSTFNGDGFIQGSLTAAGGVPLVVFFGFLVGLPFSAINGLVFWFIVKYRIFEELAKPIKASGINSRNGQKKKSNLPSVIK